MRQLYNIELLGRMEQQEGIEWARTVENVEISAVVCLGFPPSNLDVATNWLRVLGFNKAGKGKKGRGAKNAGVRVGEEVEEECFDRSESSSLRLLLPPCLRMRGMEYLRGRSAIVRFRDETGANFVEV